MFSLGSDLPEGPFVLKLLGLKGATTVYLRKIHATVTNTGTGAVDDAAPTLTAANGKRDGAFNPSAAGSPSIVSHPIMATAGGLQAGSLPGLPSMMLPLLLQGLAATSASKPAVKPGGQHPLPPVRSLPRQQEQLGSSEGLCTGNVQPAVALMEDEIHQLAVGCEIETAGQADCHQELESVFTPRDSGIPAAKPPCRNDSSSTADVSPADAATAAAAFAAMAGRGSASLSGSIGSLFHALHDDKLAGLSPTSTSRKLSSALAASGGLETSSSGVTEKDVTIKDGSTMDGNTITTVSPPNQLDHTTCQVDSATSAFDRLPNARDLSDSGDAAARCHGIGGRALPDGGSVEGGSGDGGRDRQSDAGSLPHLHCSCCRGLSGRVALLEEQVRELREAMRAMMALRGGELVHGQGNNVCRRDAEEVGAEQEGGGRGAEASLAGNGTIDAADAV